MIDGKEKLELNEGETGRHFSYITFKDLYAQSCSIQDSSIATAACIWLGMDSRPVNLNEPDGEQEKVHARMHLNRKQVKQLIKILQRFVDTGTISK